jgi:hypothetical protein
MMARHTDPAEFRKWLNEEPHAAGEPRKVTQEDLEEDARSTMAFFKAMGVQQGAKIGKSNALRSGDTTDGREG